MPLSRVANSYFNVLCLREDARALADGHLAGAAFDTFACEPVEETNPLLNAPGVILTPHCVGHTVEAFEALTQIGVANVRAALAGEPPRFIRNPAALAH